MSAELADETSAINNTTNIIGVRWYSPEECKKQKNYLICRVNVRKKYIGAIIH